MERLLVSFLAGLTTFILLYTFADLNMGGIDLDLVLSLVFGAVVTFTLHSQLE